MRLIDSIQFADSALRDPLVGQVSYLKNLSIGKFDGGTIHAPIIPIRSVPGSVKHIIAMGAPGKVFTEAVGRDSVEMAGLQSWRTRANKGFQYKAMNQEFEVLPIFGQGHLAVDFLRRTKDSLGRVFQGFTQTTTPIRPYAALIGNIISGEVGNWFPNFFGGVKILASHVDTLLHGVILWLEPVLLRKQRPARLFIST